MTKTTVPQDFLVTTRLLGEWNQENTCRKVWKDSPDIPDLSLEELQSLLFSSQLTVDKEESIFKAIERWIGSDQQTRKEHIQTLVDAVRLPCCKKEFLLELLTHPFIGDCPSAVSRVKTLLTLSEHDPDRVARLDYELKRPRPPDRDVIYVLGGRTSPRYDKRSFETLDPVTHKWIYRSDVPDQPRGETAAHPMGMQILVIELDSESVRCFDPTTRQWLPRAPFPLPLRGVSTAAIDNKVYIMGGFCKGQVTNKCFVYDYSADTWESQPSMRHRRSRASATVFQGKIYCSGGHGHNHKTINNVESFDLDQGVWSDEAPMIHRRWGHSLVACSKYLWAFGGCRTVNSLCDKSMGTTEVYDPESNTWEKRSDLRIARAAMGTCVFKTGREGPRTCLRGTYRVAQRIRNENVRQAVGGSLLWKNLYYKRRKSCFI